VHSLNRISSLLRLQLIVDIALAEAIIEFYSNIDAASSVIVHSDTARLLT